MTPEELISKTSTVIGKNPIDLFLFGSRVYGTSIKNSDYDLIAIVEDVQTEGRQYNNPGVNITVYSVSHFQQKLKENKPFAIECFYLPKEFKLIAKTKYILEIKSVEVEYNAKIEEDLEKLRQATLTGNYKLRIRQAFFIKKLQIHLELLKAGKELIFDLKDVYYQIKKELDEKGYLEEFEDKKFGYGI